MPHLAVVPRIPMPEDWMARPLGTGVVALLNAIYGHADEPALARQFIAGPMPSSLDSPWVNTRIDETRRTEQFVILSEHAPRLEVVVTYWNDHRATDLTESQTYNYLDFERVINDVSYFLLHGTRRRPQGSPMHMVKRG